MVALENAGEGQNHPWGDARKERGRNRPFFYHNLAQGGHSETWVVRTKLRFRPGEGTVPREADGGRRCHSRRCHWTWRRVL